MNNPTATQTNDQYSLAKILGIWLLAAFPMGILGWVVAPALAPDIAEDPIGAAITRVGVLTVGLVLAISCSRWFSWSWLRWDWDSK